MPVTAPAPLPLAIERVERSRAKRDQVRLRLSGRWVGDGAGGPASDALLVIQIHGRRHRFAAAEDTPGESPQAFSASFTIPDWAVPEQPGQAVLWVGDDVVPVPPPGASPTRIAEPAAPAAATLGVHRSETDAELTAGPADDVGGGRSGPLSDLLLKETVMALHAELDQRTAELTRLRASLLQGRAEGEGAAGAPDPDLERAHIELREELRRLIDAVGEQRREFDAELASVHGERDRVREELDSARTELDSARGERDAARVELAGARAELEGARAELDQARADREIARTELDGRLASARAEFDQELAAVRAESEAGTVAARREADAEAELARQETEAMLAAARAHSDTRAEAAEVEARELAVRLREHAAGERRRAEEATILREQLAAAHVARDAALAEGGGLRAELERIGGELAALREQSGHAGNQLSEARQLLADARALTDRLRGESSA